MSDETPEHVEEAILRALTDMPVEVTAGPIFKDTAVHPLTHEGALTVLDRLRARGFRVSRV